MKKKILLLFVFYFSFHFLFGESGAFAQNLAGNPGFEQYTALPTGAAQWNLAVSWSNCNGGGSPDYAHILGTGLAALPNNYFATVSPHSGDAIMGFILWHTGYLFREYLSTPLSSPLTIGQTYTVSFYLTNGVHNGNYGGYAVDQVGAAFSTSPLTQANSDNISITPHYTYPGFFRDTTWQLVSFQLVADSAYQYITFGNFANDVVTDTMYYASSGFPAAYYFIDDVDVELSNLQPVAAFFSGNHICPGTCTNFTNLSQNATSYQWTFAGASPSTSTDADPTNICYNTPGSYDVTLIATNAIGSDTLTLANYITVYPYPPPQGIQQIGDTLIANQGAVSYQWYYNGNSISGATDYFYVATQDGDYNVVCTDVNGCEVEAVIFDVTTSVEAAVGSGSRQEIIYPNPVREKLEIRNWKLETTSLCIFNMIGEKVWDFPTSNIRYPTSIDVTQLLSGMYYLEINSADKTFRTKFVKQ